MFVSGNPERGENPNTSITIAQSAAVRYSERRVAARYTYPLSSIGNVKASQHWSRTARMWSNGMGRLSYTPDNLGRIAHRPAVETANVQPSGLRCMFYFAM